MEHLATNLLPFFGWLVRATWQASLLIVLILAIQKMLGNRLGVRGRYCLWLLVLIRLAMPWVVSSPVSVYNVPPLLRWQGYQARVMANAVRTDLLAAVMGGASAAQAPDQTGRAATSAPTDPDGPGARLARRHRREVAAVVVLSLVWLGGVCLVGGCIVARGVRLWRVVRRGRTVTDRRVLGLLDECRQSIGTRARVGVVALEGIGSPALFGLLRPRLLLPSETLAEARRNELRHIFLHELAHLKRHDIAIGHVMSLLHVLHWFNPLIGLGFRRMQAERELACDGLALSVLHPDEAPAYGHTIVRQVERLLASPWRPALPGLCGDKTRIKRRIEMISLFEKRGYRWSPLAAVLVACLACIGLTDALAAAVDWDLYARRDFRTTHQDKHENIQRCCLRNMETGKYLTVDGETLACDAAEPGEAGLWEFRFDEASNTGESAVYFYSVAARKYLVSDDQGHLTVSALEPEGAAAWGTCPHPQGVWLISHFFKDGYLRLGEQGTVSAVDFGRDSRSCWDVHRVWRVKTSDDPRSNPEWQREKIPGPD